MTMNPTPAEDPYLGDTEETLREEAENWVDACHCEGDPGYCAPDAARWKYESNYDISRLTHLFLPEGGAKWFEQEVTWAAEDGRAGYYADMLDQPISEAIIVLEREGKGYIWDGWHRTAAAITQNLTTIRAIVGIPHA